MFDVYVLSICIGILVCIWYPFISISRHIDDER